MEDITKRRLIFARHAWDKEGSLLENAPQGRSPLERPRGCGKNRARRELEGNIVRKRKLGTNMLDSLS